MAMEVLVEGHMRGTFKSNAGPVNVDLMKLLIKSVGGRPLALKLYVPRTPRLLLAG
jgi:hypothetical protein